MKPKSLRALCTGGLTFAPSQILGGVRLVPLIRETPSSDLRLGLRSLYGDLSIVDLGGRPGGPKDAYLSYIPHGLVVSWSQGGEAAVMPETRMGRPGKSDPERFTVGFKHRMVKRGKGNHLRMLPGHVAFEGFLALHFGGPDVKHEEYSLEALGRGLGTRSESTFHGSSVLGLEDALRVFEMHEGQCGVMVYVADALASVTVVGHPNDYAALHRAIVTGLLRGADLALGLPVPACPGAWFDGAPGERDQSRRPAGPRAGHARGARGTLRAHGRRPL